MNKYISLSLVALSVISSSQVYGRLVTDADIENPSLVKQNICGLFFAPLLTQYGFKDASYEEVRSINRDQLCNHPYHQAFTKQMDKALELAAQEWSPITRNVVFFFMCGAPLLPRKHIDQSLTIGDIIDLSHEHTVKFLAAQSFEKPALVFFMTSYYSAMILTQWLYHNLSEEQVKGMLAHHEKVLAILTPHAQEVLLRIAPLLPAFGEALRDPMHDAVRELLPLFIEMGSFDVSDTSSH